MIPRLLRLLVACLPLACGLALLPLVPQVAETPLFLGPRSLVRLDPLGLVGIVLLALGAARPGRSSLLTLRHSLAVILACLALLVPPALLQLALLCMVSLLLLDQLGWGWCLALIVFGSATFAPATIPSLPALIVAAFVGCCPSPPDPLLRWERGERRALIPLSHKGRGSLEARVLQPLWLLLLVRSLADGAWPLQWTLLVPLIGIVTALWIMAGAFVEDGRTGVQRIRATMLMLGFASIGFGSTLSVAAVLWIVLMSDLLLLWSDDVERGARVVPISVLLFAAWWAAAAAAGARSMLPAAAAWITGSAGSVAIVLWPRSTRDGRFHADGWDVLLILLLVSAGVTSGALTRFAAEPVAAQLGAGLSAFGLIDTWAWIGVAGLDPGHHRVAMLPVVPLVMLLMVLVAAAWLTRRLWVRRSAAPSQAQPAAVELAGVARHVWWL